MGGIIHVVQLQFKPDVGNDKINSLLDELRALKSKCVLEGTDTRYIESVTVGADNSIEGHQNGFSHMMVMTFRSTAHRDYYAKSDPAHLAVLESFGPFLQGLQVLDIDA